MNIVSNNCTGGFIYSELLHSRFSNPFIWCRVSLDDFLFLMQYWDSINFLNARLVKHGELLDDTAPFAIRVDDKFEIRYTHYYFNSRCETPEARQYGRGTSFFSNKIWEIIIKKYISRVSRMNSAPIFVINDDKENEHALVKTAVQLKSSGAFKYPVLIISNQLSKTNINNLQILNANNIYPPYNMEGNETAISSFLRRFE